jgi:hypothetical protein
MKVHEACFKIFDQLTIVVSDIEACDFTKPSKSLSNATIGQHIRHTIEFFVCFQEGYAAGVINYDKRRHDKLIESDKSVALESIQSCTQFVKSLSSNEMLKLEVGYDPEKREFSTVETNTMRELVYNIEHAVHHMAIIKIGVKEVAPYLSLPQDFGVAASTIRHKEHVNASSLQESARY